MSEPLFFEDREGEEFLGDDAPNEESIPQENSTTKENEEDGGRKPVWIDEDDDEEDVNLLNVPRRKKLRKNLTETNISGTEYAKRIREFYKEKGTGVWSGKGGWAELPSEKRKKEKTRQSREEPLVTSGVDSEEDVELAENVRSLLHSAGTILSKRKRSKGTSDRKPGQVTLAPDFLDLRILPHANEEDPNRAEARCVEFHPSGSMLLTAGLDKTLRIFMVDGERCSKIQGIHVQRFPIYNAKFTGGGTEVVLTGRRKNFYQCDLNSGQVRNVNTLQHHDDRSWEKFEVCHDGSRLAMIGQGGKVVLVSNKSKHETGQLRHNGPVSSASFAPKGENENYIYTSTLDGTLYLWDVRKMACVVDKHKDEGAVHNTTLAVSQTHYAAGSDSGVVNVYSGKTMSSGASSMFGTRTAKPEKSLLNLTTQIDDICFNADGQIMAFSSHMKKNAVRFVHTPTMRVFKNWPSSKTNVRRVCKVAFSPGSGYVAIGNDKGDVHMMRLKAYAPR